MARTAASVPALDAVRQPVDACLETFLAERVAELHDLDEGLEPVGREVTALVGAGSKRLRPAFVYWGHRAAGAAHDERVFAPAAAVELLHTFALIHDDVMDRAAQRRGRPAVHEALATTHDREGLLGDARWFGVGGAILAGDLAFVWADQLLDGADLDPAALGRARTVYTRLRTEVMAGQYLDLRLSGTDLAEEDQALHVALLKSGRYTVTRPLQLGAAIAGADEERHAALAAYGDAVGLAFQLRDDVLGLFGDPADTGKGALEDLREGKRTLLVLRALQRAGPAEREVVRRLLGNRAAEHGDAERVRQIVVDCGALESVEALVADQRVRAHDALAAVGPPARDALAELADFAAARTG